MHCLLQLRKDVFPPFHDDGGRLVLRENHYLQKRRIFRLCVPAPESLKNFKINRWSEGRLKTLVGGGRYLTLVKTRT